MKTARTPAEATGWIPGVPGRDPLVALLDLDADQTLAHVRSGRRAAWRIEAEQMVAATHWADLHRLPAPGADETDPDLGSISLETRRVLQEPAFEAEGRTWSRGPADARSVPGPDGIEGFLRMLGEGCYLVAEFAVTELATALQMNEPGARAYLGQALECRDRLPRIWAAVLSGVVPAWKARQVARLTLPLNEAAADFVDRSLHQVAGRIGLTRITRAVEAAVQRCDPELAGARAEQAAERRGVWVGPAAGAGPGDGTAEGLARIDALVDTPDAEAFELAVADLAAALGALGDEDALSVRRSKAVGILADPRFALEVDAAAQAARVDAESGRRRPREGRGPVSGRSLVVDLHLHLDPTAADPLPAEPPPADPSPADPPVDTVSPSPLGPVVRQGDLRAVARAAIERWLRDLAPDAVIRVRPVVDVGADLAVDAHEVPVPITDQVDERDLTCQFPWCGRRAGPRTADRDHIEPYVSPDDGGPPGQTSARRLARLCRYHHRVKTHGGWRYLRAADQSLSWTSPRGQVYRVDRTGTRLLSDSCEVS